MKTYKITNGKDSKGNVFWKAKRKWLLFGFFPFGKRFYDYEEALKYVFKSIS